MSHPIAFGRLLGAVALCSALAASAQALEIRIDFAANSVTENPTGNWNTMISPGDTIPNLTDFGTGAGSNVSLTVTDSIGGPGDSNAGQWSGLPEFPSWIDPLATNDYFYLQAPSNPTGRIEFSGAGLAPTKTYRVEVLGSRSFGGTYGDYKVNGVFSDNRNSDDYVAYDDGYVAHDVMTWRSVAPDGSGKIILDLDNVEASVATYSSAMRISDTQSILIDIGSSSYETTGNWNNATSLHNGHKVLGAIDAAGQQTGVSASIVAPFIDINTAGVVSDAAGYASTAQRDSFAVDTATGTLQIEGLVPGQTYDITLFGSQQTDGPTNNRTAAYTVGGTTKELLNEGNTTETVTFFDVAADQHGHIQIDTAAVDEFGYLGVVEIVGSFQVVSVRPEPSIFVDFGDSNDQTDGNWNNLTDLSGSVTDAVNSVGEVTDVDVVITRAFGGLQVGVDSNDAGFPGSAQRDNFYIYSTGTAAVRFEDLQPGGAYDLTVFGSRTASSPRVLSVTVNGQTMLLDNSYNDSDVLTFHRLGADAGGNLLIEFTGGGTATYGYLSALQLTYVLPEPSSLCLAGIALLAVLGLRVRPRRRR